MKSIDEAGFRTNTPDGFSHDSLLAFIDQQGAYNNSQFAFSNVNDSDFVVAHAARLVSIVSRSTPYTDFEIKMNMALKGIQSFDFNSPVVYNFPSMNRGTSKVQVIDNLEGYNYWGGYCFDRIMRIREPQNGRIHLANSIGVMSRNDVTTAVLYAPVVRLDKFAEFRKNSMFAGKIDWPATVTYWINEDFLGSAKKASDVGILGFYKLWRDHFLRPLSLKHFRIEFVSTDELAKLCYTPQVRRVRSLSQLREEAITLLTETRNMALAVKKGDIMSRMSEVTRDYLGEFMAQHAQVSEVEGPEIDAELHSELIRDDDDDDEDEDVEGDPFGPVDAEEAVQDVPAQPAAEPGEFWQHTGQAVHQGVLGQIEQQAEYTSMGPITVRDIERIAAQLSQDPPQERIPPRYIAAVDPYDHAAPPLYNAQGEPVQPEDIRNQDAIMGHVQIGSRGFGRSAFRTAQQQAALLREIAERERRAANEAANRLQIEGLNNVAVQATEAAERERLIREYPYTPEQAFGSQSEAEAEELRRRMAQIQHSVVHNPPRSFDGIDALREEYERLRVRLEVLLEEALRRRVAQEEAERYRQNDMVIASAWALIAQQQQQANNTPIGGLNYGTPGEMPPLEQALMEDMFREPEQQGSRVINEAIAAEETFEELLLDEEGWVNPDEELEHEARMLQQTINDGQNTRMADTPPPTAQGGEDSSPDVFGGDSAFREEDADFL